MFVKIKLHGKKKDAHFVATVTDVNDKGYEVSFLKSIDETSLVFVKPDHPDTSFIDKEQVVDILPFPNLDQRNHYRFTVPIDLNN